MNDGISGSTFQMPNSQGMQRMAAEYETAQKKLLESAKEYEKQLSEMKQRIGKYEAALTGATGIY